MNNHHEDTTISISIVDTESQSFNATESCIDPNSPYLTEYGFFENSFSSLPNIDTSVSPYSMNQAMQSPVYEFSVSDGLNALSLQTDSQPGSPQSPYQLDLSPSQSEYESSESGSLHSPDPANSPISWYTGDALEVPFSGRGRSLYRSVSCRHSPYASPRGKTRSPSNVSAYSEGTRMSMPIPQHYRSRSLSDASSSSPNGTFSDGASLLLSPQDALSFSNYSSREHSPASSHYSDVPVPLSSDNEERRSSGKPNRYRTKVGSKAIQDASASRRKKEAKFFCEESGCASSFTTQQNLLHHINSHKGEKPYPCKNAPECQKRFGTPHVANRHSHSCPKTKKMTSPHTNLVPPNTFYRHHV